MDDIETKIKRQRQRIKRCVYCTMACWFGGFMNKGGVLILGPATRIWEATNERRRYACSIYNGLWLGSSNRDTYLCLLLVNWHVIKLSRVLILYYVYCICVTSAKISIGVPSRVTTTGFKVVDSFQLQASSSPIIIQPNTIPHHTSP